MRRRGGGGGVGGGAGDWHSLYIGTTMFVALGGYCTCCQQFD